MDALLENFMNWEGWVGQRCRQAGHWCDAADPRTGFPVHGVKRRRWNEVQAARQLLGYPVESQDGICPLLSHPEFGEPRVTDKMRCLQPSGSLLAPFFADAI
jgi:hypothetical protein